MNNWQRPSDSSEALANRLVQVNIRIPASEKRKLDVRAKNAGMTIVDYIRKTLGLKTEEIQ